MARIIIPLKELRESCISRLGNLDRVRQRTLDLNRQKTEENKAHFKKYEAALVEIFGWLLKTYESTILARYRYSPPKLHEDHVVFSVQPDKEARDRIKTIRPDLNYRWTAGGGHLGIITVPSLHHVIDPDQTMIRAVRKFYDRLPTLGEYQVDVDVDTLKSLGIEYDYKNVVHKFEEL